MKNFIKKVFIFLAKSILIILIVVALTYFASWKYGYNFSTLLFYIGVIFILIGCFSWLGRLRMETIQAYVLTKTITNAGPSKNSHLDYLSRDTSLDFLLLMAWIGIWLIVLSVLLT